MKKLVAVTGMILISCVCVGSLYTQTGAARPHTAVSAEETRAESYVIRDRNGKIAVFKSGSDVPLKVTSTRTSTLPKPDIIRLKNGIYVQNKQELERILEDYCS